MLSVDLYSVLVKQGDADVTAGSLIRTLNDSLSSFVESYREYLDLASVDLNLSTNDPTHSFRRLISQVDLRLSHIHKNRHCSHDQNPLLNVQGVRLPKNVVCFLSNILQIYILIDEYDAFANRYMDPPDTNRLTGDYADDVLESFLAAVKYGFTLRYGVTNQLD